MCKGSKRFSINGWGLFSLCKEGKQPGDKWWCRIYYPSDALHTAREVPCALRRETMAKNLASGGSCGFCCHRVSLMLIAAPISQVKAWHPPLEQ